MKKNISFFVGVLLTATVAGSTVAFLPGCASWLPWALNAKALVAGSALVATGTAISGNYSNTGSAKSAVDPVNPVFSGITTTGSAGATAVNISWNAATDVGPPGSITYRIFYSTSSDEATILSGSQVTVRDVTTATITQDSSGAALTPGATYYAIVRAEDATGNTDGNTLRVSARTNLRFGGVTSITPLSSTSLRASWTAAEGATASLITYTAYVSTSSDVATLLASTTVATSAAGATSVDITGLTVGTFYQILVRARSSDNNEGTASPNTVVASGRTRLSFGGITSVTTLSATSVRASWSSGATGAVDTTISYTAYASTSSDVSTILASTNVATSAAGATSVDVTGLTSNTLYNILVRATTSNNDEGTTSANTATRSARTRLAFDGVATFTATASNTVQATWSAPPNIAAGQTVTYTLYISSDAQIDTPALLLAAGPSVTTSTTTETTVTSPVVLTPDTLYRILVRATASNPANTEENNVVRLARTWLTFSGVTGVTRVAATTAAPESRATFSSSQLNVTWAAATGLVAPNTVTYRVYRATSSTTSDILAGTRVATTETSTRLTELTAGTHRIIVRAISNGSEATEDLNTTTRTGITAASVSGTITESGSPTGNLIVILARTTANDNDIEGAFQARTTITNATGTSNPYTIPNISPDTLGPRRFIVRVIRDTDQSGGPNGEEPSAASGAFDLTEGQNLTGTNITITIP